MRLRQARNELLSQQAEANRRNGDGGNTEDGGGDYLDRFFDRLSGAPGRLVQGLYDFVNLATLLRDAGVFFDPTTLGRDWQNTWSAVGTFAEDPVGPTARFIDALADAIDQKLNTPEGNADLVEMAITWFVTKRVGPAAANAAKNLPLKKVADFLARDDAFATYARAPRPRVSGHNPPISSRQTLHIDGTPGKSQFISGVDVESVVRIAWESGTPIFNKNGAFLGKRYTFTSPIGTSPTGHPQTSIFVHWSPNNGIHGVPTTVGTTP